MDDFMTVLLQEQMNQTATEVEAELQRLLAPVPGESFCEPMLDSMRYSILGGGKRIRPFLVTAFASLFASDSNRVSALKAALPFACALEMIHTYSLIHDDLPCMDDDDLRRGKPSNHKVFGEAGAVLAGDALQALAFEVVAAVEEISPARTLCAVKTLAACAGPRGMVGGQVLDLANENRCVTTEDLDRINERKTGSLICAACLLGAYAAGADAQQCADAIRYAKGIGKAFQMVDDVLDVVGTPESLGKNAGVDAENAKTTYASLSGVEACLAQASAYTEDAVSAIRSYEGSELLIQLAKSLLERQS